MANTSSPEVEGEEPPQLHETEPTLTHEEQVQVEESEPTLAHEDRMQVDVTEPKLESEDTPQLKDEGMKMGTEQGPIKTDADVEFESFNSQTVLLPVSGRPNWQVIGALLPVGPNPAAVDRRDRLWHEVGSSLAMRSITKRVTAASSRVLRLVYMIVVDQTRCHWLTSSC